MTSSTAPSMESIASQELKRKSGDVGWEYGVLADPNKLEKVKCILCGKIMSGGIHRLKQHIAQITGDVASCKIAAKEDQIKCRNALNKCKDKKKGEQDDDDDGASRIEASIGSNDTIDIDELEDSFGSLKSPRSFDPVNRFTNMSNDGLKQEDVSNVVRKEKMIQIKKYICRWAYECGIPFHAFEKDSFKMLLEAVGKCGPTAQPPTQYEMGDTYLRKEVERTKNLLKRYEEEWKLDGCSIMTNTWSDRKRSIINICVNSKLGTVFLSSKESSNEAHISEHIFKYVDKCIEEVGPENVVQVVTDNASNNIGAAKLLKLKRPTIFWTSCATHTVNLMIEAIGGLSTYKKVLDQAKKLTVFIYAHHKTLALTRLFTKKRDIVRPGVTRFASAFLTLQSLVDKKSQLRHMFSSDEWNKCKFSNTVKGKSAYATVVSPSFWADVTLCLKVFTPLVKVLRMVDTNMKPSMGFIYGELQKTKKEIIEALGNNKKAYEPIIHIIEAKMKDRLDTSLHLTAYLLNPFYLYNNLELQHDMDAIDATVDVVDTLFPGDYDMQNQILMVELPMYKGKLGKFNRVDAIKGCEVNDEKFDPASWWGIFGGSAPRLRKIAMRILSLTTSSSGCERNGSMFEGVHTRKRNRLEATKLSNLIFVQFNANLMEKNKKGKTRGIEVLLANDTSEAQDWIVEIDEDKSGPSWETVGEATGAHEQFESESEEEVDEEVEVEYESDGVQIIEQYGQDDDGSTS